VYHARPGPSSDSNVHVRLDLIIRDNMDAQPRFRYVNLMSVQLSKIKFKKYDFMYLVSVEIPSVSKLIYRPRDSPSG
jgi:hypothetical protein